MKSAAKLYTCVRGSFLPGPFRTRLFALNAFCDLSSTLVLHRGFIRAAEGSRSGIHPHYVN